MQKALQAKADALTARLKKGDPIDQVAASVGAKPQTADLRRDMAQQQQTFSSDLMGKVFAAKAGETVVGQDVKLGLVVAKVDKIATSTPHDLAVQVEAQRDGFRSVLFNDVSTAARNAARAEIKPKVDYDRARTAIGLEAQAPAGGAKK
jgi:peptidyl-prolyl cis-trans isomerase D